MKKLQLLSAMSASLLFFSTLTNAATLQLDFGVSFGDPTDSGTATPSGSDPYLTALFDDGDSIGSVTLTLTVSAGIGDAEVTAVYLNVDDAIGAMIITAAGGTGPTANSIQTGTDAFKPDADGWYDILFNLPPPGMDTFDAGETLTYTLTATGLLAASFNFASTPDANDLNGPFLGAAKFQSTGDGSQSDWIGVAVPIPAAVWLFGSALGLLGWIRRREVA